MTLDRLRLELNARKHQMLTGNQRQKQTSVYSKIHGKNEEECGQSFQGLEA
jgi:hypothetical protein